MTGDISRTTFEPQHSFARVLMQQGRVLLDADWNEQTSILLHFIRTLAADLIGPHGGPGGFQIICQDELEGDFVIGPGHYYVDGILCENYPPPSCRPPEQPWRVTYHTQPTFPLIKDDFTRLPLNGAFLVYLHVWERHVTHFEYHHIREVALGGPDTCTRAQIVWQVQIAKEPEDLPDDATCKEILDAVLNPGNCCLRARARVERSCDDPCIIPPQARYRGLENQLYRVEIHDGGSAGAANGGATFKWSRDNGSVVFGIRSLQGSIATLQSLGPDECRRLAEGNWVEIVDDFSVLRFAPRSLAKVTAVDPISSQATLDAVSLPTFDEASTTSPLLRRWDQRSDVIPVHEGKWIELEDGVQVYFEPGGVYRTGDYWLIPARTAVGDVLWSTEQGPNGEASPKAVPPHGIEHHYAPLARISVDNGVVTCEGDCRCILEPMCKVSPAEPPPANEEIVGEIIFDNGAFELSDESKRRVVEQAAALKERFESQRDLRVDVRGYAAPGEPKPDQLSEARAKRVAEVLSDNGVPPARMTITPRGTTGSANVPAARQRRVETVAISGSLHPSIETKHPVREVDGIGETFAQRLEAAGITDASQVVTLTPAKLASILRAPGGRPVHWTTAAAIIEDARRLIAGG